mmetsp:Transcript_41779/g.123953  ORF Transcript_41779/g.123953 Transcript_41779/m.123953 type:complete len:410 (-) Transcript_41779:12-1241(-)
MDSKTYDPTEDMLVTCLRWARTVLPRTMGRKEFWLFFCLHLVITALYRLDILVIPDENSVLYVDDKDLKVLSSLTTFFQVFYANQCYARYLGCYSLTRKLLLQMHRFAFVLRIVMNKPELKPNLRMAMRYMIASNLIFFFEFNRDVSEDEWQELIDKDLLNREEKEFLVRFDKGEIPPANSPVGLGCGMHLVLLHWSGEICRVGFEQVNVPGNMLKELLGHHVECIECQQHLVDQMNMPVPFQYFHLLNVMVSVNLFLWAYSMGVTNSLAGPAIFFCAEIIFIGLMELSVELSDPFGEDDVDFPVNDWVADFANSSIILCEYEYPGSVDKWEAKLSCEPPLKLHSEGFDVYVDKRKSREAAENASRHSAHLRGSSREVIERFVSAGGNMGGTRYAPLASETAAGDGAPI